MIARRTILLAAAALLSIPTAAAAAAGQFDLACTGTPPESGNETSATFRVDLDARQYCSGDCASVEPLVEVTDSRIVLQVRQSLTSMMFGTETKWLDRVNGIYHDTIEIRGAGGDTFDHRMRCETGPFSGFPSVRF